MIDWFEKPEIGCIKNKYYRTMGINHNNLLTLYDVYAFEKIVMHAYPTFAMLYNLW